MFYALYASQIEDVSSKLKRLPIIYSWAIIKAFHEIFNKSIMEFTSKFVSKCCQITIYELTGICVTESYVRHELKLNIQDPLLFSTFPEQFLCI